MPMANVANFPNFPNFPKMAKSAIFIGAGRGGIIQVLAPHSAPPANTQGPLSAETPSRALERGPVGRLSGFQSPPNAM